jgi:NAD(P)-dependent dehydrogenase (short-subunit alcohol dehydrogenase family)
MGVVIVTGGSRGIGADICRLAAKRGYSVCVNYLRGETAANKVVEEIGESGGRAISVKADVTIEPDVSTMFDEATSKLGPVTALVNNAGWGAAVLNADESQSQERRGRTGSGDASPRTGCPPQPSLNCHSWRKIDIGPLNPRFATHPRYDSTAGCNASIPSSAACASASRGSPTSAGA